MAKLNKYLGKTFTLRIGGHDVGRGVLCRANYHVKNTAENISTNYFLRTEERDFRVTNNGVFDKVRLDMKRDSDVLLMDIQAFSDRKYLPLGRLPVVE